MYQGPVIGLAQKFFQRFEELTERWNRNPGNLGGASLTHLRLRNARGGLLGQGGHSGPSDQLAGFGYHPTPQYRAWSQQHRFCHSRLQPLQPGCCFGLPSERFHLLKSNRGSKQLSS